MASATGRRIGIGAKLDEFNKSHSQQKQTKISLNRTSNKLPSVWDIVQLKDAENYKVEMSEQMRQECEAKEKMKQMLKT